MDFVVFGFGLGAILMLVGFALRDLGPWLFGSPRDDDTLPEFEGVRSTIRKQTLSSVGNAISVAGAGVAAVTFSALLAKTKDDIGAIVVGMSLVLAAVGVGAWSYDIVRRYRTAMDIVEAQEQSARARLAPRPKRHKPRAKPAVKPPTPAEAPANEAIAAVERIASPKPVTTEEAAHNLEAPLPDWHEDETDTNGEIGVARSEHDAPLAMEPEPVDDLPETDEAAVAKPERTREAPREPDLAAWPKAPVEPEDALIDESVKIESPAEPRRALPSWLFDDLETDLTNHGANKRDDAIDQFQEVKPVTRPSALERLLADDDDANDAAKRAAARRQNPPKPNDQDKD